MAAAGVVPGTGVKVENGRLAGGAAVPAAAVIEQTVHPVDVTAEP